jgi:hypothetical protein
MACPPQYLVFRCHLLCSPLAGLLCYMLLLSGRSPSKILFTRDSGRVFQLDLLPLYNDKGSVERIEVVPYRLTRNLATFFTAFGVEVRGESRRDFWGESRRGWGWMYWLLSCCTGLSVCGRVCICGGVYLWVQILQSIMY